MIEQGFNFAEFTIKEMTDFFETRIENLQLKEETNTFFIFGHATGKEPDRMKFFDYLAGGETSRYYFDHINSTLLNRRFFL